MLNISFILNINGFDGRTIAPKQLALKHFEKAVVYAEPNCVYSGNNEDEGVFITCYDLAVINQQYAREVVLNAVKKLLGLSRHVREDDIASCTITESGLE